MAANLFKVVATFVRKYLRKKASLIDHKSVVKDVYREVDISAGYFFVLNLANLIALTGLVMNSVPVIIGAMLISPLMGPILSFGFAFITGDKAIWNKSLKKLSLSIAGTIIVAAVASYFSPLSDVTTEIISRTRPNLYDLIIAFLSGTAGAIAICTKKNYLTIVPGVAIATAVIPPLSVAGFGLGTGHFGIFAGGFFLFFTNFVAIIISTCIVFYLYGFKPAAMTDMDIAALKRRVAGLAIVLFVISIPLIYTLYRSITEVKLRNNIQSALKMAVNKEKQSEISKFNYAKEVNGTLLINAVVNTTNYMKESEVNTIEKEMGMLLHRGVKLYLEQIKVQPGGLKDLPALPVPAITQPKPPAEVIASSRRDVMTVVRRSSEKVEKIISPSTIEDFYVAFYEKKVPVSINLKIRRDQPVSPEEKEWLKNIFAADLNMPVDLSIETMPFVPPLIFGKGETSLSEEMKKELLILGDAYVKEKRMVVTVEADTDSSLGYNKRVRIAGQRLKAVRDLLIEGCKIPASSIKTTVARKATRTPAVRVSIVTDFKK